ncbi:MAG: DUF3810 domain-containing protein [Ilyomonas sp.]
MNRRSLKQIWIGNIFLLLIVFLIKAASFFPKWIEEVYSTRWYPAIAAFLRSVFGWIPFGVGDILYAIFFLLIIIAIVRIIVAIFKKRVSWYSFFYGVSKLIRIVLNVYIVFNILWGLNYDRLGISYQLNLIPSQYETNELQTLTDSLISRVNFYRSVVTNEEAYQHQNKKIFQQAAEAYHKAETQYPFLLYRHLSIKNSLYGYLGNYLGFLGYYNPFSGEANVNTTVPAFIIPYVTCHEIGHQLGYGSEDEASFAGFLAVRSYNNNLFNYSMYFDLFNYANNELFARDSIAAKNNFHKLDTLVRFDQKNYRRFLLAHRNPVEPLITKFYSEYLKANNQPEGIKTYSQITAWLIAFQKKYGTL